MTNKNLSGSAEFNFDIVFEDQILIVVNKHAGIPTQASEIKKSEDLYSQLKRFLKLREKKEVYLALHHRLDAATEGLVLFCKDKNFNKYVTDLFREKKITKKYLARVEGPQVQKLALEQHFTIDKKIKEVKVRHFKLAKIDDSGDSAQTNIKVVELYPHSAILECTPITGRLHQIRIHLASMNLPIVGDFHYNKNSSSNKLALMASTLEFMHPRTKKHLRIEIPKERVQAYFFDQ